MKASDSKKMQKRERVEIVHLPPSYTEPEPDKIEIGPFPISVDGPVQDASGATIWVGGDADMRIRFHESLRRAQAKTA